MNLSRQNQRQKVATPADAAGKQILSSRAFWIAAVGVAGAIFAAYLPSLDFQFILDDHVFLSDPRLQSPGHVGDYFSNYTWSQFSGGPSSFYRPLFVLWLRVNFIISEMSPWGWHLLSIVKHLSVAALLGLLVWMLLRDRVAVLIAAGLFALHPAQTESVAWVTVPDPLMSIAVLAAVLCFIKYTAPDRVDNGPRQPSLSRKGHKVKRVATTGKPSVLWLIGAATACFAAMLVKETGVLFAPALLCLSAASLYVQNNAGSDRREGMHDGLIRVSWLSIPFAFVTMLYLLLRFNALGKKFVAGTQQLSFATVLWSIPETLWFYVKVMLWPVQLRAFADSSQRDAFSWNGVLLPGLGVCCAGAVLAGTCLWIWKTSKRNPSCGDSVYIRLALMLGVLLLVIPIVPALNLNALNPGDFLHGRYTYLALAGLMLLLATTWHLAGNWRIHLLFVAGGLAVAFALLTLQQETAWKDDLTVFTVAQKIAPHNEPVAINLARAEVQQALKLDEAGRCGEALPVFERVTRRYPDDWFAWAGLGDCLVQLNELPRAEQSLRRAADLSRNPQVIRQWEQVRAMLTKPMAASSE